MREGISAAMDRAEALIDEVSEALLEPPSGAHLSTLEAAGQALYAAGSRVTLSEVMGQEKDPDFEKRRAEAEETIALIARHLAANLAVGELPRHLRGWKARLTENVVNLPSAPQGIPTNVPDEYHDALADHLAGLSDAQCAGLLSGDLRLPKSVVAELLAQKLPETGDVPDPVPLDDALVPMAREVFEGSPLAHFLHELEESGRINCDKEGAAGFAFSIAEDFGGLPYIYVPRDGTFRDLILLCHHLGHGFHQWVAQRKGSVLDPIGPTIDEVIPVLCELRCEDWLARANPAAAKWITARRRAEVEGALSNFQEEIALIQATLSGSPPENLQALDLTTLPGFQPPRLSSYSLGSVVAERVWRQHGWDFGWIEGFAAQAADADLVAAIKAGA
ncbi:hypothetical protein [Shimia ponticola]|uniref:hypothetical protein n=1 Tax=Shimia ponticola TaxID=2582893 RepID=UPI0011BECFE8|nr:hypothetical protein [Shimia ponticola]